MKKIGKYAVMAGLLLAGQHLSFPQNAGVGATAPKPGQAAPAGVEEPPQPAARQRLNEVVQRERAARLPGSQDEGLNDEMRAKVREITEKNRESQRGLYEKLRAARTDLEASTHAETIDEASIRAKAAVIGQIEGELAIIRAKQSKELKSVPPKEQYDRFQNAGSGSRLRPGGVPGGVVRPGGIEGGPGSPERAPAPPTAAPQPVPLSPQPKK